MFRPNVSLHERSSASTYSKEPEETTSSGDGLGFLLQAIEIRKRGSRSRRGSSLFPQQRKSWADRLIQGSSILDSTVSAPLEDRPLYTVKAMQPTSAPAATPVGDMTDNEDLSFTSPSSSAASTPPRRSAVSSSNSKVGTKMGKLSGANREPAVMATPGTHFIMQPPNAPAATPVCDMTDNEDPFNPSSPSSAASTPSRRSAVSSSNSQVGDKMGQLSGANRELYPGSRFDALLDYVRSLCAPVASSSRHSPSSPAAPMPYYYHSTPFASRAQPSPACEDASPSLLCDEENGMYEEHVGGKRPRGQVADVSSGGSMSGSSSEEHDQTAGRPRRACKPTYDNQGCYLTGFDMEEDEPLGKSKKRRRTGSSTGSSRVKKEEAPPMAVVGSHGLLETINATMAPPGGVHKVHRPSSSSSSKKGQTKGKKVTTGSKNPKPSQVDPSPSTLSLHSDGHLHHHRQPNVQQLTASSATDAPGMSTRNRSQPTPDGVATITPPCPAPKSSSKRKSDEVCTEDERPTKKKAVPPQVTDLEDSKLPASQQLSHPPPPPAAAGPTPSETSLRRSQRKGAAQAGFWTSA